MFLCCLRAPYHRRLVDKHRVLHSSTILDVKAIFLPPAYSDAPSRLLIFSNVSNPPPIPRHLVRVIVRCA